MHALSAGFAARSAHRTHAMNKSVKNTVLFISNCFFSFYATALMQVKNSTNRNEQGEAAPFSKKRDKNKNESSQCLILRAMFDDRMPTESTFSNGA